MSDMMIGMEVHVGLKTDSKLFCSCKNVGISGIEPNTVVCPVCLGHPGSKPMLNKKVVDYAIQLATALKGTIHNKIQFSRKIYFYPDLAKNFQITQYENPLSTGGKVVLDNGKEIRLRRLHIEEDPAALVHQGATCLVDYNRSGTPLVEIVTEPDLSSPEEAREFMNKLVIILNYLGFFDVDTCVIKADGNVSIKETSFQRVEVKNITGFKEIERALNYEVSRQRHAFLNKEAVINETRGWDAERGVTYSMRTKESEEDYGYIVEPDLSSFDLDSNYIKEMASKVPELAHDKSLRYEKLGVDKDTARIIAADPHVAKAYETILKKVDPVFASNWTRRELLKALNLAKKSLPDSGISVDIILDLFSLVEKGTITPRIGQEIIVKLVEKPFDVKKYVESQGLLAVSDESAIKKACEEAIKENPVAVADYKKGEEKAFNSLVGQVMKKMKGKAVPAVINKLLKELV